MTTTLWSDRARWELALLGVDAALADEVLAEVREHCADSGERPEQAFGEPADFAAGIAADRMPLADRANRDRSGTTVFEAWSAVMASAALVTILAGAALWLWNGLLVPLTPAGLAGIPILYAALLCLLYAVVVARPLGKPRTVVPAGIATAVLVVLAACAFVLLPREAVASMPAPVLLAAGVLLAWWAFARRSTTRVIAGVEGAGEWLVELRGLLEGRHDVARDRADDLVRETAQHLRACGRPPREEFGPVDEYAVTLAHQHPAAPVWWRRETTRRWLLVGLAAGFVASAVFGGQPTWYVVIAVALLIGSGWLLARGLRGA
ncbi:hypothetical protein [Umezawaea tangerina]|uniref:Uncharacterized protein n=1 Tax=Umezawaea tangerina TaxID=84725 RepID=A0A2T0T7G6_9PSEU|nr:hypothetical protein [Umezawaea tangerina]PRY41572.1 hypothetical protein CLV43_105330 [Umezawaea tangerina]